MSLASLIRSSNGVSDESESSGFDSNSQSNRVNAMVSAMNSVASKPRAKPKLFVPGKPQQTIGSSNSPSSSSSSAPVTVSKAIGLVNATSVTPVNVGNASGFLNAKTLAPSSISSDVMDMANGMTSSAAIATTSSATSSATSSETSSATATPSVAAAGMANMMSIMKGKLRAPKLQVPGRPQPSSDTGVVSFSQKRTAEEFLPGCSAGIPDRQVVPRLEPPAPVNPAELQLCKLARTDLKAVLQDVWNNKNLKDMTDAVITFHRIASNPVTLPEVRHKVIDLLEIPLIKGLDAAEYASVVALNAHVGGKIDPRYYTKLLVMLIQQSPVNTSLVRLTLNMSLGEDVEAIPLVDPNAIAKAKKEAARAAEEAAQEAARKAQEAKKNDDSQVGDWRTAQFMSRFGDAVEESLENDEDWREKALEASLGAKNSKLGRWNWGEEEQKPKKVGQPASDDVTLHWLTLSEDSLFGRAGYPKGAPAVQYNKAQRVFMSAHNIMLLLVNDITKDITIEHDENGSLYPEIRDALITAKAAEEPYAVAKCPALEKWGVGIGTSLKTRETAAKLALALAISKGHEGRITMCVHFPELKPVSDKAELCQDATTVSPEHGGAIREEQGVSVADLSLADQLILAKVNPAKVRGAVKTEDPAISSYYGHFMTLLHLETLVELGDMQAKYAQDEQSLVRAGWTLSGMRVQDFSMQQGKAKNALPGAKVGKKKVRVIFVSNRQVDWSKVRFRPGDWVTVSRTNPLKDSEGEGMVHSMPAWDEDGGGRSFGSGDGLVIMFDTDLEDSVARQGTWRIDKAPNRTAYERQMMALLKLANSSHSRPRLFTAMIVSGVGGVDAWASKMKGAGKGGGPEASSEPASEAQAKLQQIASEEVPLAQESKEKLHFLQGLLADGAALPTKGTQDLNPSQRLAVASALGRRLTLIQGPPGTGKTHVSVNLMSLWARGVSEVWPLLCTSGSNIAVDNIAEGCIRAGLKVIRIGRPEKVSPQLEQCCLEIMLKQQGQSAGAADWWGGDEDNEKQRQYVDKMKLIKEADVVCATTIVAGSDFLQKIEFGACLIDEVAQATELSAIVPIFLRNPARLVLVGDHCQLPPNSCSQEAEKRGVTLSLFGRLHNHGLEPFFLDTQFRMHPKIAEFSARQFYDGRLKTGITAQDRPSPRGFKWPNPGCGVAFIDCEGREWRDGDSYTNNVEMGVVVDVLEDVIRAGGTSVLEIGVVSPYSAQVRGLRQWARQELQKRLPGADLTGGLTGKRANNALEIASVDAFQGREKDLIVFTAVRSNYNKSVGFLGDWRRLNVMLTRARCGIIVIGNDETLRGDPTWRRWLDWAKQSNLYARGYGDVNKADSSWQNTKADNSSWSNSHSWNGGGDSWSAASSPHANMVAMMAKMMEAAAWSKW